jgi:hypothetical protein
MQTGEHRALCSASNHHVLLKAPGTPQVLNLPMVWCNGFSNGLLCISGKCSGMESGDGPRESLWETLTGVEQSLRTSTGDVPLLVRFGTDNMFVP